MNEALTPEQIQKHYDAAMDSVHLLNGGKPAGMSDADWADCVTRNKEHLKLMIAKDYWQGQDLSPLQAAAA